MQIINERRLTEDEILKSEISEEIKSIRYTNCKKNLINKYFDLIEDLLDGSFAFRLLAWIIISTPCIGAWILFYNIMYNIILKL